MHPVPSTCKMIWHKAFERSFDECWVDWAIEMIEAGFESENLYMLAGSNRPFYHFEMSALTTAVMKDLSLDYSDKHIATRNYAYSLIKEALDNPGKVITALHHLQEFYYLLDRDELYSDFYLLYLAVIELRDIGYQFYWEGANLENIDAIIRDRFLAWMQDYEHDHAENTSRGER